LKIESTNEVFDKPPHSQQTTDKIGSEYNFNMKIVIHVITYERRHYKKSPCWKSLPTKQ